MLSHHCWRRSHRNRIQYRAGKTGDRSVASQRLGDIRAREERLILFTQNIETEEGSRGFGKEQQIRRDDECLGRYGYA
jgi:hypothetical protein